MVSAVLQQELGPKRKRETSNQSKKSTAGSSERERADSQTPKKRKRYAVIESVDEDGEELRRTGSSESDSQATDNGEYEIEKILAQRVDDDGQVYYTVRWKNYPPEADSEVFESDVDAPKLIRKFEREQQKRSSKRKTSSSQLPTMSSSKGPTLTLPNKVVNKNIAKTSQKGLTSLPQEKSASVNSSLQKSAQKRPCDTVGKSPSKQNVSGVRTSRTPVKELPSIHTDNPNNVSNVQSKPSNIKASVRLTIPTRKEGLAMSNDGLFLLGKKKLETTAGLHPKERMILQERREKEAETAREKRMSTENTFVAHPEAPTPQEICSTSIVLQQPAALAEPLKKRRVPSPPSKKRAAINSLKSDYVTESILPIAKQKQRVSIPVTSCHDNLAISKESTYTTVTSIQQRSEISFSVKASGSPKEKQKKTHERTSMATPSEPQGNRLLSRGEASNAISVSLTRQEANLSVTKTIREDVKARVTQPLQSVITRTINDVDNSQLSELQIDIITREMDEENANQREEEHWRRGKEQKRQESLAEQIREAGEKERLGVQKNAKASKETELIYDPRAATPSDQDDEIYDPRAIKDHKTSANVPLPRKNPPALPPCLLDRGIKIEKIVKLFFVKKELVALCQYKNCLEMQIVTVSKIKEVDPQILIKAYEALYDDCWTHETDE